MAVIVPYFLYYKDILFRWMLSFTFQWLYFAIFLNKILQKPGIPSLLYVIESLTFTVWIRIS